MVKVLRVSWLRGSKGKIFPLCLSEDHATPSQEVSPEKTKNP